MTFKTHPSPSRPDREPSELRRLLPALLLSVLFYGVMLFLTLCGKSIHNARLPQVSVGRLTRETFSSATPMEDGRIFYTAASRLAIPKELFDSGRIFTVTSEERDGMTRYYAVRLLSVTILQDFYENEDFYAVEDGITGFDMIILDGYEALTDGQEVCIAATPGP